MTENRPAIPLNSISQSFVVALGAWLLAHPVHYVSDIGSGLALIVFGCLSFSESRVWTRWTSAFIGVWLLFAPLVFRTPFPSHYQLNTLIGALAIVFSVVLPFTIPTSSNHIPPGWSYNPAAWRQRIPIVIIGFFGFFIARVMTSFQLGHTQTIWDPFFGTGTVDVLESEISKAWPIPDAGLGAIAYLLESITGCMGNRNRWHTMPWMVLLFGILVVPAGVVSIVLVILQPVAIGAWCFLCLVTATATLITIPPAIDEVIAMMQYLAAARRRGQSIWRTFWMGGPVEWMTVDSNKKTKPIIKQVPLQFVNSSVPWNLGVTVAAGLWAMAIGGAIVPGALLITVSVIAMAEVSRSVRFLNFPLSVWVGLASNEPVMGWMVALVVAVMSFPAGKTVDRHGSWDRFIF